MSRMSPQCKKGEKKCPVYARSCVSGGEDCGSESMGGNRDGDRDSQTNSGVHSVRSPTAITPHRKTVIRSEGNDYNNDGITASKQRSGKYSDKDKCFLGLVILYPTVLFVCQFFITCSSYHYYDRYNESLLCTCLLMVLSFSSSFLLLS